MSRATIIGILATMLALSVSCFAQAPKVIAQKLYDQLDQANANQDLNRVLGFYDSSYVGTDAQGKRRQAFAEFRRQLEQNLPLFRRMNPSTTAEDVQLEAGRMVVNYKSEWHFEFLLKPNCWVPEISNGSGSDTWEKKGGQWKLVRETVFRADTQIDPNWAAIAAARSASRLAACSSDRVHSCDELNPPGDTLCKSQ
jgi:ketosteroid isomerase-like protein